MRLSFGNMTLDLNIFTLQKQPSGLDNVEHFTLNWLDDFRYDELVSENDDVFCTEYASSLMDHEPECDAFDFDDCSLDSISTSMTTPACEPPTAPLELKPLPDSLKYAFLGPNESLLVIVASDLDLDQETKLLALLQENKEAIGWTLGDIRGISSMIVQHKIHLEDNAKPYKDR